MPYSNNRQLPRSVKNQLPKHAQDIYREAYNNFDYYNSDLDDVEERAHKVAWSAVKRKYRRGKNGYWIRKLS